MQFLVEEALMARLDIVEADEKKQQAENDAVAATEKRIADRQRRQREAA